MNKKTRAVAILLVDVYKRQMQTVITINAVIMALFFVCYSYQFFYVAVRC